MAHCLYMARTNLSNLVAPCLVMFAFVAACQGQLVGPGLDDDTSDGGELTFPDGGVEPPLEEDALEPVPGHRGTGQAVHKKDSGVVKPDSAPPKPPTTTGPKTWFVRAKGGTPSQCTGLTNADYPGSGTGQACALSHIFFLLPPSGKALLKGSDTVIIGPGAYRMGLGAPGAGTCDKSYAYDCAMQPIPSGTAAKPTRILGLGYNSGCKQPPQLFGVQRSWRVLDLSGSSHVELQCLEVTDHSGCVESHSGKLACQRNSYPYGDWAVVGIRAKDSQNVLLRNVDIHGMAHSGIQAGRLKNWTLEDVKIEGNGWVGWDGDLGDPSKGSSNSGKLIFRRVSISWNGCGETYPGRKPAGCWGQTAGGYGDGLGTQATAGDWLFEDCKVMHNTSDGIDLLYHSLGGTITVRRMRAEGNAGNQLKITGDATITNSILVGNCSYFQGKSFTHNVDPCRALGNTLSVDYVPGAKITLTNSTLYGEGDVLVQADLRKGPCNGKETLVSTNNIFIGAVEYHAKWDRATLFYNTACSGLKMTSDYNLFHGIKEKCPTNKGANDLCADPQLGPYSGDTFGMMPKATSPAVDTGKPVGGAVPSVDFMKVKRPAGKGVDRGACEVTTP